ncbi:MAG TPA: DNA adenine methylase [Propionibacteriaceae bacterium]|nr:DNA adenine methylase [Propionibacteriaceae bacterium]
MRPPFPYFGGKVGIADAVVAALPPHAIYVEPYAGSAAVLLAKPPARQEILNDRNQAIVTFFRVLRDRPGDLEVALRLTPYARDEYLACRLDEPDLGDLEVARRFFVRSTQSVAGIVEARTTWSTTGSPKVSPASSNQARIGRLHALAARLAGVVIDNRDALDALELYAARPDAVVYADPPYLAGTRAGAGGYHHDAPDVEHHQRLADALQACPGFVVVSGYPSPLYDDLYEGWRRIEIATIHRGGRGEKSGRTEVLWLNRPVDEGRLPFAREGEAS